MATGARHLLLHARHFLERHLDAEIAARHHQRVGEVENVVQSRHRLRLFDLGHHRSAAARDLLCFGYVFRPLDEGERDPIDAGIERCFEISEVLRRQRGDRNDGIGQAHAFAACNFAADFHARDNALRFRLGHDQSQLAVVDQERVARLDGGEDFRMRQVDARRLARRWIGVEDQILAGIDLRPIIPEIAEPQFRSLQIDQDADRPLVIGLDVADRLHELAHLVVARVTHIDAKDVGAGLEQPLDHRAA